MPNIVADRGVCPEMINDDVTPEKLASVSLDLYSDKSRLAIMKASLSEVRTHGLRYNRLDALRQQVRQFITRDNEGNCRLHGIRG
jgi:lipid A disaccharide synthetase